MCNVHGENMFLRCSYIIYKRLFARLGKSEVREDGDDPFIQLHVVRENILVRGNRWRVMNAKMKTFSLEHHFHLKANPRSLIFSVGKIFMLALNIILRFLELLVLTFNINCLGFI